MDKLEFDDRIRRLERRSSIHQAMLAAVVLVIIMAALYVIRSVPEESSTATQFVVSTPAPPLPPPAATARRGFVAGMTDLESDLKKAHGLMTKGLITPDDFATKKAMLLEEPLKVLDFAGDIEAAKTLADASVLTGKEYDSLKKKILESGHP